ncbi:MAG: hypothetical protein AAFU78_22035, partial [Cyanobacteria bacterium J06633_2]
YKIQLSYKTLYLVAMTPNIHYERYIRITAARKNPMSACEYADRWVTLLYGVNEGEEGYRTRRIDVVADVFPHVNRDTIKNWFSTTGKTPDYAGYALAAMDILNSFIYGETIDEVIHSLIKT